MSTKSVAGTRCEHLTVTLDIQPSTRHLSVYAVLHRLHPHHCHIGRNEPTRLLDAFSRYSLGGVGYVDAVAFDNVFESINGTLELAFVPAITVRGFSEASAMMG